MARELIVIIRSQSGTNTREPWTDRAEAVEFYEDKLARAPDRTTLKKEYEDILRQLKDGKTMITV